MDELGFEISIYRAGYVYTDNIFKEKSMTDERIVNYYELVIFLANGGYFLTNGKKYTITAGSCRLYRPGDRVASYKFNDVYAIHFDIRENQNTKGLLDMIPTFFTLSDLDTTVEIVKKLSSSLLKNDLLDSVCRLCELLSYINSQILRHNYNENTIVSIKKYLDMNFSKCITLDDLSKTFYLHPVYLQRKFKQEYDVSPTDYITRLRINHAKDYLISTNLSIEEISYKTGFSTPSYFIRVFKKFEHCTPHQYRKIPNPHL